MWVDVEGKEFEVKAGIAIFAFMLAIAGATAAFGQSKELSGDVEKGRAIFVKNGCYQCHGYLGQGTIAGARLMRPVFWVLAVAAIFVLSWLLVRYFRRRKLQTATQEDG